MATYQELLTQARSNLDTALQASAGTYVDYKIGNKTVSKSQYIKHQLEVLTKLEEIAHKYPDAELAFAAIDFDISEFGEDLTQYVL